MKRREIGDTDTDADTDTDTDTDYISDVATANQKKET